MLSAANATKQSRDVIPTTGICKCNVLSLPLSHWARIIGWLASTTHFVFHWVFVNPNQAAPSFPPTAVAVFDETRSFQGDTQTARPLIVFDNGKDAPIPKGRLWSLSLCCGGRMYGYHWCEGVRNPCSVHGYFCALQWCSGEVTRWRRGGCPIGYFLWISIRTHSKALCK